MNLILSQFLSCRDGLVSPIDSKIDVKGWPCFWIGCMIITSIFEIKIHEKNSLTPKKADFYKATDC